MCKFTLMPRKMKGGKPMEAKSLTLRIRKDIWEKWKILAIKESTTMSEIAEKLIGEYLKKKGGA